MISLIDRFLLLDWFRIMVGDNAGNIGKICNLFKNWFAVMSRRICGRSKRDYDVEKESLHHIVVKV